MLVLLSLYLLPVIIGLLMDYLSCPPGTTLRQLITGNWPLDEWDDIKPVMCGLLWIPFFNYAICLFLFVMWIIRLPFWDLPIKNRKNRF